MTRYLSLVFVLGLAACGYNEDSFTTDFADAYCNKLDECDMLEAMTFDDVQACIDASTDDGGSDSAAECDFDKDAAQECVDGVKALACDDFANFPSSCANVCG